MIHFSRKKFTALVMSALVIALLFTGCSNEEPQDISGDSEYPRVQKGMSAC